MCVCVCVCVCPYANDTSYSSNWLSYLKLPLQRVLIYIWFEYLPRIKPTSSMK